MNAHQCASVCTSSGPSTSCCLGFVNHAHAALAEQTRDLMGAELCADGQDHDFVWDYRTRKVSGYKTALS